MIVKLVKSVARDDGVLVVHGKETFAKTYLAQGWTILGLVPGSSVNEVQFVLRQDDEIVAAAEMVEEAEILDTTSLKEVG